MTPARPVPIVAILVNPPPGLWFRAGSLAPGSSGRDLKLLQVKVPFGVVEALNGNLWILLRRGRGYRNLRYLLLKAQRMAATKTEFVVLKKAA